MLAQYCSFIEVEALRPRLVHFWVDLQGRLRTANPSSLVGCRLQTVTERQYNLIVLMDVKTIQTNRQELVNATIYSEAVQGVN